MEINDNNAEENSHLLGAAPQTSGYGAQPGENNILIRMVQAENKSKTFPQYVAALAAAGGALATGILLGWTSPAQPRLVQDKEYEFEITNAEFSWIGAVMTLGAACVCIPFGSLINIFGRKIAMLLLVLPFTIGWALLIWAQNVGMMYAGRFVLGIAGGAFCVAAPMYIGEIAQKEIRGTLGSFFQLMITIGILFVYVIGWPLSVFAISLIGGAVPILFAIIFFFMPETPIYLVSKGRDEKAIESIQWLRGKDYDYSNELSELQEEDARLKANNVSIGSALLRQESRKALLISLGLMFFQQLSGINAVIFYTTDIFSFAKITIDKNLATIIVGIMQVIATFVSAMVVDKLGRRLLLLASGSVMAICTILLGLYLFLMEQDKDSVENIGWLPIVSLCVFIVLFSVGYGPVPWLMLGELFAPDIKGIAGSISTTVNWLLAFIVTKTYDDLNKLIGNGPTFWVFSVITILGVLFVFLFVPETKGKSLVDIQKILKGEKPNTTNTTESN